MKRNEPDPDLCLAGEAISVAEARERWGIRYRNTVSKIESDDYPTNRGSPMTVKAKAHYNQAMVDGVVLSLGDDVYVQAGEDEPHHIAKIIELFEGLDGEPYFRARWFYRPENTVIKEVAHYEIEKLVQDKRVFLSNVEDDNPLNCIVCRIKIAKFPLKTISENTERVIPPDCEFFYDMHYELDHFTFSGVEDDTQNMDSDVSTVSSENESKCGASSSNELYMLDLYAGCGAMSTGLTMGASYSGVKVITKWAVDMNQYACSSLKLNHPETEVRNETAEDFLNVLKEWRRLCQKFRLISATEPMDSDNESEDEEGETKDDKQGETEIPEDEFEIGEILAICYGNPKNIKDAESALHFKVRWKGYGPDDDTWEPYDGIRECKDKLKAFVTKGFKSKLLPLPGDVHIVCGGPPCQGISGFNRFRDPKDPFADMKNWQLVVYMNIIEYLKPAYVLMENVVDLVKFAEGFFGRYAIGRLVNLNYQTRIGIMAAGSYGVPQCRFRVFLWGARAATKLPPFPLPTHKARNKSVISKEFEDSKVVYKEVYNADKLIELEPALFLKDAIEDLPEASNYEMEDAREYTTRSDTDFQKFIRLKRSDTLISANDGDNSQPQMLFDHQPLRLNADDYERVCLIPKKKGANFRDLGGIIILEDNTAVLDPTVERATVKSGKPLIPDYALSFKKGRSLKPFGRLWWDEIVNTVLTRAEPHNLRILHPLQDRVLSVRETARLQGFPDFYRLFGPIKQKYIQVGNAVAVPVGFALGYALGMANQGLCDDDKPVIELPFKYPECLQKKEDSARVVVEEEETS